MTLTAKYAKDKKSVFPLRKLGREILFKRKSRPNLLSLLLALPLIILTNVLHSFILSPQVEKFFQKNGWNYGWGSKKFAFGLSLILSLILSLVLFALLRLLWRKVIHIYKNNK